MQKCKFFIVTIQQFSNKNLISNASHCIIVMYLEEAGNKESFRLVFYFILSLSIWFTNAWLEYFQFRCFLSFPWPCMYVKRVYDLNYVSMGQIICSYYRYMISLFFYWKIFRKMFQKGTRFMTWWRSTYLQFGLKWETFLIVFQHYWEQMIRPSAL